MMFRTLVLLSLIAASALALWEPGLKVRFDLTLFGLGTKAFFELPLTTQATASARWVATSRPDGPSGYASLELWCPSSDDVTVCVLMDNTGYIAGLQIALDKDEISDGVYDWQSIGFTEWTLDQDGTEKNYWTTQQYYISTEDLATDPATRIAKRDTTKLIQGSYLWVSGFNGELYGISTNVSDITGDDSDFTPQACIPWMGKHYYYNMSSELTCSQETMFPWFPLVDSDQLIGVGLVMFGKYNVTGTRNWFENPTSTAVKIIVPRGPECLYNLADTPGVFTMHSYFIERPYGVTCIF